MQNFVDQPRIHPDEKIEVFVVLDPVKGYRIACDGLLESSRVEPTKFVYISCSRSNATKQTL